MSARNEHLVYLDNNATTPVDPAVVSEMLPFLTEYYGNPSSAYRFGKQTAQAIDKARERVAALLGCEPREIVFTSCGTEGNNTAIASALQMDRDRQHIVTTKVEHSAITKHCELLARRGYEVRPGRWATPASLKPERGRYECFCWAEAPPGWRLTPV